MALSFVGSTGDTALGGGSITLTLPGPPVEGDVVYVAYGVGDNAQTNFDMAMTTAGYTELADLYHALGGGRAQNFGLFRKVMGPTPDTQAQTTGRGSTGNANVAICHVWRGADTTTPEDATTVTSTRTGNSTAVDTPSITTVTDNAIVLTIGAATAGTLFTPTAPTGYSNGVTRNLNDSNSGNTLAMASKLVASFGSEDPGAFGSFTPGSSDAIAMATVAIRPAPVAPIYEQSDFQFFNDDGFGLGPA